MLILECDVLIALIKTHVECLRVKGGANQYNELQNLKKYLHNGIQVAQYIARKEVVDKDI